MHFTVCMTENRIPHTTKFEPLSDKVALIIGSDIGLYNRYQMCQYWFGCSQ